MSVLIADASDTEADSNRYDIRRVSSSNNDADETAEILADFDFTNALRESIEQFNSGDTRSWEEIKVEMGL